MYNGLHVKFRYSHQILIKLELTRQNFEKHSNIKFYKIRPVAVQLFYADGRTDRHDEAKSRLTQFSERA